MVSKIEKLINYNALVIVRTARIVLKGHRMSGSADKLQNEVCGDSWKEETVSLKY